MMTLKLPTTIVAEMIKAARTCGDASPLLSRKNTPVALVGLPQPRSSHFDPHVAPPLILKAEVRPPSIQAVMLSEITYRKESFASGATALLHVVDAVPDFITKLTTVTKFVAKLYHANVTEQNVEEALSVVPILQHPNIVRVVAVIRGRPLAKEEEEEAGEGSGSQEQNKINEDVHHSNKDVLNSSAPICGLLMERCIRTLAQELRSLSPPPISARLQWLYEVARAIYFAHCSGINHSDISPTKVLLVADKDDRKIAKLSDFGSAYVMQTLHTNSKTNNNVKGALERSLFMAPEYASGEPLTQACDVFSFGMTMWSVLYPGKDHGLGSSLVRIALSLKCNKRPPLPPLATWDSKPILDLISECWATKPDERPRMEKVLAVLQQCLESSAASTVVASHELWHQYLGQSLEFVKAFDTLNWNEREPPQSTATAMAVRKQVLFSEPITEFFHPCHAFVRRCLGAKFNVGAVTKIVMVYPRTHVTSFIAVHNAENHSRLMNSALRLANSPNPDYEAAIHRLKSVFIQSPAVKNENAKARIFFAWHGTEVSAVDRVCEDGPRSLSTTDSGFFGSGSYFALEAWYASRFSKPSPAHDNERCLILFAVSISQAYVITLDGDYRDERATDQTTPPIPEVQTGWPRFYIGDDVRGRGMALAPKCDAHFIPVKYYGHVHPLTKVPLQHDVDYQAASESEATAHEIVIGSHHRCVPLAVVYFRT
ncbi:protein kinase, putative [Bodo saltans]|uniref:Protein kinase, putative n=1 Tax=Bodo saltans TaxID=75058 RepID=A0A0S4KH72_BODSA|nr:protein kinase, putative [Bodo saltans]|eukprot:CUI11646.1 protein kinase, putative [Bodo saltans]